MSAINAAILALYDGSTTFQSMIDGYVAGSGVIRIATGSGVFLGAEIPAQTGNDHYLIFDLTDIGSYYFLNEGGVLTAARIESVIAHEMIHYIDNLDDVNGSGVTELQMNGASFDFEGDTVRKNNIIMQEMWDSTTGFGNHIQTSYLFWLSPSDAFYAELIADYSYSHESEVDLSRWGTTGNDTLDHSSRTDGSNDLLFGRAGADTLSGGDGGDFLWGGADADTLNGGDGNDLLSGDGGSDTIDGGDGADLVTYELATSAVSMTLIGGTPGGAAAGDTLTNVEGVIGSAYADTISLAGQTVEGVIEGRGGNDTLTGGDELDYIFGDAGNDILYGGDGDDTLSGREDDDTVNGDDGDDNVSGEDGTDILNGGAGVDSLWGGDGDDVLDGGDGADYLMGGGGDDILIVNGDYWNLDGGDGTDSYWFTSTASVTLDWLQEYGIECDSGGSIKYDGNVIGGDAVLLTEPMGVGADYLDSTGCSYASSGEDLWIWLPTNEAIYVNGWTNGDMGIYLPGL